MSDCIFCKMAKGEIPTVKIWEDDEFFAILDLYPNTKGMTLVIPKNHYDSDIFEMDEDTYQKYLLAVKKVVKILEKGLKVKRGALVFEGLLINHAHVKLYPVHGLNEKFESFGIEGKYFDKYPGYTTTIMGPKADNLEKVSEEIKNNQ